MILPGHDERNRRKSRTFVLGFLTGVITSIVGALIYDAAKLAGEAIETRPTRFSVSLADAYCRAGEIHGLISQRRRLGNFGTDDLVEHARVCANHDFIRGSTVDIVHQLEKKFHQCFNLTLEDSEWVLRLKTGSSLVCRSKHLSTDGKPVYYCLVQPADPHWEPERSSSKPRNCPEIIDTHFSSRNASSEIP